MKKFSLAVIIFLTGNTVIAQNVGIGTTTPHASALPHIDLGSSATKGLLVTGSQSPTATVPDIGAGTRLMFYPGKVAFRAGQVSGNQWDESNVGNHSIATGYNTIAKGAVSTAFGSACSANGSVSTAMGLGTIANGFGSTSLGFSTSANGQYATAMGVGSVALGDHSFAMGTSVTASGHYSTAMGNYVSTSNFEGAFSIGDHSTTAVMPSFVANGFRSRFAGGYRLLTNSAASLGVVLVPDATSWSAISDKRLKENFLPVNGEEVLKKIAALPLTTWNYKEQLNKSSRHYGPMAQDFFAAFGKDDLGEIGCDTLINQHDFLGVNLIAIQALEKRTGDLQKENDALKKKNESLEARLEKLESLLANKR